MSVTSSSCAVGAAFVVSMLLTAACSETSSPSMSAAADPMLQAHSPGEHGGSDLASLVSAPAYGALETAGAEGRGGSVHLMVRAGGEIPRHPDGFINSVAVFGYAWADLGTGKAVVAVIHPVIGRDSRQNPDGWHTHPVQLAAGTASSAFCIVSIGRSQGGIAIKGDELRVHMALRWAGIDAASLDVAAAFVVQGDPGCATSGLGVVLLGTAAL